MRIKYRPKRLDLYIFGEVLLPFLGGVVFFVFIFLMFQALRLADLLIIHGVSGPVLLKMTALLILSFLPMALPIAFLIGILIGFGRMSTDSEIVALKANGISYRRMSLAPTILAMIVVGLSLGLNLEWVPRGDHIFKSTLIRVSNTKVVSSIKEGTFTSGFFDLLVYAEHVDKENNQLQGVFIYDERDRRNPQTIVARQGEILPVQTSSELGAAAVFKLKNGNIHRMEPGSDKYEKIDFGEYNLLLQVNAGADTATIKPRMIPYSDLRRQIRQSPSTSSRHRELVGELSRRIGVALSPLIFVFLGMGFASVRTRAVRASAALIAFGVILFYWATQAYAMVAAQKGWLNPVFALQIPNLVCLLSAMKVFRSANW
jgi:lipopolysaccharide export system permease protein